VHTPSGTNIATVVGLTPGSFDPVAGPVFFGLNVAGPLPPFFMTTAESTAILNLFTPVLQGVVPASGGGTTNFLRADGTWASPGASSAGWDDVLLIDPHSGASNAFIDTGQYLSFGTAVPDEVTGDIRSDGNLFIHPDVGFELQAHDTIYIHGPDTILIENTGGSPVRLLSSVTVELESTGGPVELNANTFVDVTNGFILMQEQTFSTPVLGAGKGLFWVRDDVPCIPMFTDDTNVDFKLLKEFALIGDLQNIATARILGRVTAGSGDIEELTGTQATTLLDTFTSSLKGLAPASGGGTTNFLRADGTWAAPPDTNTGHVIRVDGVAQTQRAAMNLIDTTDILVAPTDDAGGGETELRWTFAPVAANTFAANATAGSAAYTPVAVSAESIVARTSGNLGQLTSSAQSALIRAAGSLFFATAAADQVLRRSGSGDLGFGTLVTGNIGDDQVTDAKLRNSLALSVIGRSAGTAGDPADIVASALTGAVLREAGSTIGWGTVATAGITNNAITNAKIRDSGALSVIGRSANSSGDPADISAVAASGAVLRESGSTIDFGTLATGAYGDGTVTNAKLADMAAGTVKGRQIDSGTGVPVDLTGLELGENVRFETTQTHSLTGASQTVTLNADATLLVKTGGTSVSIVGITGGSAGRVLFLRHTSGGGSTTTIEHDAGTVATEGIICPGSVAFQFGSGFGSSLAAMLIYNSTAQRWLLFACGINRNEDVTWGDSHTFNGSLFTVNAGTSIRLLTAATERLEIEADGAWQLGGDAGTEGCVLASRGASAPPVWQLGRNKNICEWYEDFEYVTNSSLVGQFFGGSSNWMTTVAGAAGGSTAAISAEAGHPGIVRLQTHTVSGTLVSLYRGSNSTGTPVGAAWVRGDQIRRFEAVVRPTLTETKGLLIGFAEELASVAITGTGQSHIMAFMFDSANTSLDVNLQCVTRESDGTATVTDSGISMTSVHGTWITLEILQDTLGTVEFLINGSVVATHNTQVPDSETMNCGCCVVTRAASATALDIDYVSFISQPLDRTAG
jgi:hypothetical protein